MAFGFTWVYHSVLTHSQFRKWSQKGEDPKKLTLSLILGASHMSKALFCNTPRASGELLARAVHLIAFLIPEKHGALRRWLEQVLCGSNVPRPKSTQQGALSNGPQSQKQLWTHSPFKTFKIIEPNITKTQHWMRSKDMQHMFSVPTHPTRPLVFLHRCHRCDTMHTMVLCLVAEARVLRKLYLKVLNQISNLC